MTFACLPESSWRLTVQVLWQSVHHGVQAWYSQGGAMAETCPGNPGACTPDHLPVTRMPACRHVRQPTIRLEYGLRSPVPIRAQDGERSGCTSNHRTAARPSQNALARKLPFCYATMLGSHNSGITLADGYGTLDPYFQKYFEWVKFAVSALGPDRWHPSTLVVVFLHLLNCVGPPTRCAGWAPAFMRALCPTQCSQEPVLHSLSKYH